MKQTDVSYEQLEKLQRETATKLMLDMQKFEGKRMRCALGVGVIQTNHTLKKAYFVCDEDRFQIMFVISKGARSFTADVAQKTHTFVFTSDPVGKAPGRGRKSYQRMARSHPHVLE